MKKLGEGTAECLFQSEINQRSTGHSRIRPELELIITRKELVCDPPVDNNFHSRGVPGPGINQCGTGHSRTRPELNEKNQEKLVCENPPVDNNLHKPGVPGPGKYRIKLGRAVVC